MRDDGYETAFMNPQEILVRVGRKTQTGKFHETRRRPAKSQAGIAQVRAWNVEQDLPTAFELRRTRRRGNQLREQLVVLLVRRLARAGRLEVTALSLAAYPFVQEDYALLPHGASIGSGYGPVLVGRTPIGRATIAVLGINLRTASCSVRP